MNRTLLLGLTCCAFALGACSAVAPTPVSDVLPDDFEIITLLPKDAIRSIDRPRFYSVTEADNQYDPDEPVLGVSIGGDSRAYSVGLLSSHEIVNDTVGGHPIAVTW